MNKIFTFLLVGTSSLTMAQSYAPSADQAGTTAIKADSSIFVSWATGAEVNRGYINISDTNAVAGGSNRASAGEPQNAIGPSNNAIVSLGDLGEAILTFDTPITNGDGPDFAVFENGFSHTFLELAHVEVSSDGIHFVRFPSHSETQTDTQIGGFGAVDARYLYNLAGKYKSGFGTPFDLEELKNEQGLNVNQITHVKIIDVVGSLGSEGTKDAQNNMINDPFPTPFTSGGFDLDAVGVIHEYEDSGETTGLSTNQHELSLHIFPNPSTGIVNIRTNGVGEKNILISNSLGQKVKTISNVQPNEVIQVELPKGIYFIHIETQSKLESRKVVVR